MRFQGRGNVYVRRHPPRTLLNRARRWLSGWLYRLADRARPLGPLAPVVPETYRVHFDPERARAELEAAEQKRAEVLMLDALRLDDPEDLTRLVVWHFEKGRAAAKTSPGTSSPPSALPPPSRRSWRLALSCAVGALLLWRLSSQAPAARPRAFPSPVKW